MDNTNNNNNPSMGGGEVGQPIPRDKFWTPELRKQFLDAFIDHITHGFSDESFSFMGSGIKLFKTYREKYAAEFPADLIEEAQAKRMKFWETVGIQGTVGKMAGFNAMSWKFNMQNRFKWKDRIDETSDDQKIEPVIIYKPEKLPEGS